MGEVRARSDHTTEKPRPTAGGGTERHGVGAGHRATPGVGAGRAAGREREDDPVNVLAAGSGVSGQLFNFIMSTYVHCLKHTL